MSANRGTYKVGLEPLTVNASSPREAADFVKKYLQKNNAVFIVTPIRARSAPVYIDLDDPENED